MVNVTIKKLGLCAVVLFAGYSSVTYSSQNEYFKNVLANIDKLPNPVFKSIIVHYFGNKDEVGKLLVENNITVDTVKSIIARISDKKNLLENVQNYIENSLQGSVRTKIAGFSELLKGKFSNDDAEKAVGETLQYLQSLKDNDELALLISSLVRNTFKALARDFRVAEDNVLTAAKGIVSTVGPVVANGGSWSNIFNAVREQDAIKLADNAEAILALWNKKSSQEKQAFLEALLTEEQYNYFKENFSGAAKAIGLN